MVKVIFIDFDGTLYSHIEDKIPKSAIQAINLAHDKGIKLYLCSGRDKWEMNNFDLSMLKLDGMITLNGQVIYDDKGNIIFDNPVNEELRNRLVKMFNEKRIPINLCTEKGFYINFIPPFVKQLQERINSPSQPIDIYRGEKIYMASCFYDDLQKQKELVSLEDIANVTYWIDGGVDIVSKETSKATAIAKFIKILNIDQKETMAIGDGHNDIQMIKYCNIGVAVGNSHPDLLKVADYVCPPIEKDGLYEAFKHYELI